MYTSLWNSFYVFDKILYYKSTQLPLLSNHNVLHLFIICNTFHLASLEETRDKPNWGWGNFPRNPLWAVKPESRCKAWGGSFQGELYGKKEEVQIMHSADFTWMFRTHRVCERINWFSEEDEWEALWTAHHVQCHTEGSLSELSTAGQIPCSLSCCSLLLLSLIYMYFLWTGY